VVLLLTGVLPLLAKDDIPDISAGGELQYEEEATPQHQKQQNAAEKMHDDALTSIPSLQMLDLSTTISQAANIVMVDDLFGEDFDFLDVMNMSKRIDGEHYEHSNVTTTNDDESLQEQPQPDEIDDLSTEQVVSEEATGESSDPTESSNEEETEENITANEAPVESEEGVASDDEESEAGIGTVEEEEEVISERVMVDYASKSAGALILENSPSMKGASNLLHSDKDKYAISPCTDKKYVVLGLSEDILVKKIKIANYERYSSHVKGFQVLGSQTMGQWVDLGMFEAANQGNGEQVFELKEPSWARYLKFKFNTHYGSEHYCTLSQLRVHGSTMQQGFHEEWNEAEEEKKEAETTVVTPDPVDIPIPKVESDEVDAKLGADNVAAENSFDVEAGGAEIQSDEANADAEVPTSAAVDESNEIDSPSELVVGKSKEQAFSKPAITTSDKGKLPRPLPPIFDIHTAPIPNALVRARFELTSHKNMYRPPRIEALNTAAICPAAPRRHDFTRADTSAAVVVNSNNSDTSDKPQKVDYASTVSNAVRELQSRIQTTLGKTWDLQYTIQTMIGNALPDLDASWDDEAIVEATPEASNKDPEESATVKTEPPPIEKVESKPEPEVVIDEPSAPAVTTVDDSEMPVGLAEVVARYPSATCLQALHFPDFKKNIMDKLATGGGATGSHAGNKMEPVFKTLTAEIKALQMSQSVHDQFSRALVACYQSIMIEMAAELQETQTLQEDRLSKLEAEMRQMKSNNWVSHLGASVVYMLSICLSLSAAIYTQCFSLIKQFVPQALALEGGSYIQGFVGLFLSIAFFLTIRRIRRVPRPVARPRFRNDLEFNYVPSQRKRSASQSMPRSQSLKFFLAE
jgi:hypothetical protein